MSKPRFTVICNQVGYVVCEGKSSGARRLCNNRHVEYFYKSATSKKSTLAGYQHEAMRHCQQSGWQPGTLTSDVHAADRKPSKRTLEAMERMSTLFDFWED